MQQHNNKGLIYTTFPTEYIFWITILTTNQVGHQYVLMLDMLIHDTDVQAREKCWQEGRENEDEKFSAFLPPSCQHTHNNKQGKQQEDRHHPFSAQHMKHSLS